MERRSQKIDAGNDSMMNQALEAYYELLEQKSKQAPKKEANSPFEGRDYS